MPATPPGPLSDIGQIALSVRDVGRSTTFYRDVLGLPFLFSAPPNLAFLRAGSVRLMLAQPERPEEAPRPNSVIYFNVAEINAAQAELAERGAIFVGEPHCVAKLPDHELWMSFLRDPDDNLIGLMSAVRRS